MFVGRSESRGGGLLYFDALPILGCVNMMNDFILLY